MVKSVILALVLMGCDEAPSTPADPMVEAPPVALKAAVVQSESGVVYERPLPDAAALGAYQAFPNPPGSALLDKLRLWHPEGTYTQPLLSAQLIWPEELGEVPVDLPAASSPIQLWALSPGEPPAVIPLRGRWYEGRGTYHPEGTLIMSPADGVVLDAGRRHAWVFHPDWFDVGVSGLSAEETEDLPWTPAAASVFTPEDPGQELLTLMDAQDALPQVSVDLAEWRAQLGRESATGFLLSPMWMSGEAPWATEGGAFLYDDDGEPEVQAQEAIPLTVMVPEGEAPEGGWPIVVYAHGTGGSHRTFNNTDDPKELGVWMAAAGYAVVSYALPMHGGRLGSDAALRDLYSYNFLNPESAIHVQRQAALEAAWVIKAVKEGTLQRDGAALPLDPDRVVLIGHSQGATVAALGWDWLEPRLQGMVLSAGGGEVVDNSLANAVDVGIDVPAVVRDVISLDDDEPLDSLQPPLALAEAVSSPTDPVIAADRWFRREGASPVLLVSGGRDVRVIPTSAFALIEASGLRWKGDVPPAFERRGQARAPEPSGVVWRDEGTHWVMFEDPTVQVEIVEFLDEVTSR